MQCLINGSLVDFQDGDSVYDVFKRILNESQLKRVLAARMENHKLIDLGMPAEEGKSYEPIFLDTEEGLEILRHSASHVLAAAVKRLFPDARLGIGPAIENGFYYDFDVKNPFTPEDLTKLEKEMEKITSEKQRFERVVLSKSEARKLFESLGEIYKLELIDEIEDDSITIYKTGDFVDLCRGPHVPHTGYIKAFKLISSAGAYWRGDEKNPMLQRIYGTAFPDRESLNQYLRFLEEAQKRDHRVLGRELELFSFHEEAGPGLVFYHPKGAIVREIIENFIKDECKKRGYQPLVTPHVLKGDLWRISGHSDYYRDNMFYLEIDEKEYAVKPMNCPGHILVYKSKPRSYKEMPLRFYELGTVYRYERSGVLHGLLRVRGFTQDDAHIFCTPDQIEEEVENILDFSFYVLNSFGFDDFSVNLSTRPEKFVGSLEIWEKAEGALRKALEDKGIEYKIDPGEGVFYGPKIDIKLKDVLNREWQATTIQVDFNIPERFDLVYWGADNQHHRPVMIHRAIMGSIERFMGALIEHYGGAFPAWIAPVQVAVLPIADRHFDYASKVYQELSSRGFRVELDVRPESINKKIRNHQKMKVPYMLVIGDREAENGSVAVRHRKEGDLGPFSLEDFIEMLNKEVKERLIR
ncbi:MAG: threonine--tRNA ligase [Actinobacteria bacterium]|nr:threonine--tRNA ligase [Actinomycetota bacterium]